MIKTINMHNSPEVEALHRLQLESYRVEADTIGFADLPPLKETVDDLRRSQETFLGWYEGDELAGAVAYETEGAEGIVCRMMVHPAHFRKGIGSALLSAAEKQMIERGVRLLQVSTGTGNDPAIRLYEKHGYRMRSIRPVTEGLSITTLSRLVDEDVELAAT